MAVTLTSTGITFSDGTSQNTAAGGSGGTQVFNASGTFTRPTGVNEVLVDASVGGSGGGSRNASRAGATRLNTVVAINGNVAVTVGAGGNAANSVYYWGANTGGAGGTTSFGGAATGAGSNGAGHSSSGNGGGNGSNSLYGNSNVTPGLAAGGTNWTGGSRPGRAGTRGALVVSW